MQAEPAFLEKTITWRPVAAAGGYLFELKDEKGALLYEKELSKPEFTVRLLEGDYEFRVGVLNRFGKNPVFSRWYPLKVRLARKPVFVEANVELEKREVLVKGENFSREIRAYLRKSGKLISVITKYKSSSEIELILPEDLGSGQYDLLLENPRGQQILVENYLNIPEKTGIQEEIVSVKRNRLEVLWRSAVLPGWGQIYAQRKVKGIFFASAFATAVGYYLYRDLDFLNQEKKYKNLRGNIYDPAFRKEFLNQREKYLTSASAQNVAFWILLGTYTANLVDAYFFNGPYESFGKIQLVLRADGFYPAFGYKF